MDGNDLCEQWVRRMSINNWYRQWVWKCIFWWWISTKVLKEMFEQWFIILQSVWKIGASNGVGWWKRRPTCNDCSKSISSNTIHTMIDIAHWFWLAIHSYIKHKPLDTTLYLVAHAAHEHVLLSHAMLKHMLSVHSANVCNALLLSYHNRWSHV